MDITGARPTMRDVARVAGVSPKTVSNVVTGAVAVREPTRLKVEAAMKRLDYVPNLSARGLRNGRTGVIGLALADLSTAFSASITHQIVEAAHHRGLVVQLEETDREPGREYDLRYRTRTHQIDGLILNPVQVENSVVEQAADLPPVVLIGEVEEHRTDRVFIDSRAAGEDITAHLISQGAQRIVVLGGSEQGPQSQNAALHQRLQGHLHALNRAGLNSAATLNSASGLNTAETSSSADLRIKTQTLQQDAEWSITGGAQAIQELLAARIDFDAVLCFTDSLAMGAVHALHEFGVRVPQDVLVTGFDDVEHAAHLWPGLTTVGFDHRAYAEAAIELLVSRIQDPSLAPRAVRIPHRVLERASTAAHPAGVSYA